MDTTTITLEFDDNKPLIVVFGEHDKHLLHIEKSLNIKIQNKGGTLTLHGIADSVEMAKNAIDFLYNKAHKGNTIELADVDASIRFSTSNKDLLGDINSATIITPRKHINGRSPTQVNYINAMEQNTMSFGIGPAGTGKTYLAVAYGVSLLSSGVVDKIIITRPVVEAGENLGFLPGDLKEKVDPYLRPIYDTLYECMDGDVVNRKLENGEIEIAPLAYMRGRTLKNAVIILDEAQNTTTMQMKMFLTRLGENTKMIITGDISQVDLPNSVKSGLRDAVELLKNIDDISITKFNSADVVRHQLVGKIVRAYEQQHKQKTEQQNDK